MPSPRGSVAWDGEMEVQCDGYGHGHCDSLPLRLGTTHSATAVCSTCAKHGGSETSQRPAGGQAGRQRPTLGPARQLPLARTDGKPTGPVPRPQPRIGRRCRACKAEHRTPPDFNLDPPHAPAQAGPRLSIPGVSKPELHYLF